MFYYLSQFENVFSPLRVFRYGTVRTLAAAATAFLICVLLGPWVIEQLRRFRARQYERKEEAPPLYALHGHKEGTPTMGGILIILAIVVATVLWAIPTQSQVWMILSTLVYMGLVGFWDDYTKVARKRSKGLSARAKMILQLIWAVAIVFVLLVTPETAREVRRLMVPFIKNPVIADMGILGTFVFVTLVVTGSTNAVNLTDGLDGLAVGCSSSVALAYMIMAFVAGNVKLAEYLFVPYVAGSGEVSVICGAMVGACLGFLWHNCHPAAVFMGDTGSLALGGALAMVAITISQEVALLIVGGVFVMEALSVIIQVGSFKLRGKRVFAMAPLHHHFEMEKWSESQVTIRFWILSIIFALIGILTLKIR